MSQRTVTMLYIIYLWGPIQGVISFLCCQIFFHFLFFFRFWYRWLTLCSVARWRGEIVWGVTAEGSKLSLRKLSFCLLWENGRTPAAYVSGANFLSWSFIGLLRKPSYSVSFLLTKIKSKWIKDINVRP